MNRLMAGLVGLLVSIILLFVAWQSRLFETSPKNGTSFQNASQQVWHLSMGHNMPVDSAMHQAASEYAKRVTQKSGGKIQITIYPNQQLGDDHKMVEMAREGKLDIVLTPTAKMSIALPAMQYVDLPFFFPEREDLYRMLDGEPGQMLLDELKQIGLVGVTFWENGFKHFTANSPLVTPDDFRGKTFRIMKSRLIQSQFQTLGAKTLPIDFHKTRQALADGIVDGQENPLIAITSMGINEVQSDLTLSSHGYMGYVFSISAKTFRNLPTDLQNILYTTARELTPYEREETHKREAALLEYMRQNGMHIHVLTQKEHDALARKFILIAPRYEETIGSHILSRTQELLMERYGPSPQSHQQIAIGLNADLSMSSKTGGLAIKRGAELAIEEINRHGGVLGKPLVLIAKDQRGIASKGVDNTRAFIERPDVVAIVGGVRSSVVDASINDAQKAGIPYLIPWAAAANLTRKPVPQNVMFRISANDQDAVAFMGEYLLNRYRNPAILYENSIWGRGALARMEPLLREHKKSFAQSISFDIGQQNFDNEIKKISDSKADSLLLIANSIEAIDIINTLAKEKADLPVISHWGVTSNHFFEVTKEALTHVNLRFLQTYTFSSNPNPVSNQLIQNYKERYGVTSLSQIEAPSGVAQTYDLIMLLAQAIEKAHSSDRSRVRDALEHLGPYQGVIRYYNPPFTVDRHDALDKNDYRMVRYREDGSIVPVP